MNRKKFNKRALIIAGATFSVLLLVLVVHLSIVLRPKPLDPNILALARIDIKQPITDEDGTKISTWLYQQKGVNHVLCNPGSRNVVFTYYPVKVNANEIAGNFTAQLPYKAERFMPSAEQLKGGCPAVSHNSLTYKVVHLFNRIF